MACSEYEVRAYVRHDGTLDEMLTWRAALIYVYYTKGYVGGEQFRESLKKYTQLAEDYFKNCRSRGSSGKGDAKKPLFTTEVDDGNPSTSGGSGPTASAGSSDSRGASDS